MKKTRAALKDEKTYIHNPLMKKKSKKVTKAGKEQLSLAKGTVQENIEQLDPGLGDADPTPGSRSLKVSPLSYALGRIYNMIDQEKLLRQGQATLDGLDEFAEMQEASENTAGEKADAEKVKRNGDREQMDNCDAGKSEVRLF